MYKIEDKHYGKENFFKRNAYKMVMMVLFICGAAMWINGYVYYNRPVPVYHAPETIIIREPDIGTGAEQKSNSAADTEQSIMPGAQAITETTVIPETPVSSVNSVRGDFYSVFTQQQNVKDNFGITYDSAYVAYVGINTVAKKLTYSLNETAYTTLKGKIALSEKNKDNINVFCVAVYNENGDMIYKSKEINEKSPDPIEINCNISGLSKVTIELEGCTKTCSGIEIIMPGEGFVFA